VSHRLAIRIEAETDMAEAFDWYEDRQPALGHEFLAEVHAAFRALVESPLHYSVLYKNVRHVLTRRFPYKVSFFIEGDRAEVIGVIHAKRHPRSWKRRV
jgi:plasmid stabilization system protein ParE